MYNFGSQWNNATCFDSNYQHAIGQSCQDRGYLFKDCMCSTLNEFHKTWIFSFFFSFSCFSLGSANWSPASPPLTSLILRSINECTTMPFPPRFLKPFDGESPGHRNGNCDRRKERRREGRSPRGQGHQ
ncbi:hypothetical protein VTN49DRAFT_3267 [Thermomyces lanuginosus]|uniref:uncharacterized protein n=1 Tax=Thermomyces lanuginosus TaxID=5541 RepID=UPI00374277A2